MRDLGRFLGACVTLAFDRKHKMTETPADSKTVEQIVRRCHELLERKQFVTAIAQLDIVLAQMAATPEAKNEVLELAKFLSAPQNIYDILNDATQLDPGPSKVLPPTIRAYKPHFQKEHGASLGWSTVFKEQSEILKTERVKLCFRRVAEILSRAFVADALEKGFPQVEATQQGVRTLFDQFDFEILSANKKQLGALLYQFVPEPGLYRWLSLIDCDEMFLDVGANIGCYSIFAAKLVNCEVHAVEPFSVNYDALKRNVAHNQLDDLIHCHKVAIGDKTESGSLSLDSDQVGSAGHSLFEEKSGNSEDVECWRLDDLLEADKIPFPNHIKIDVDGQEWRLFEGMGKTLKNPKLRSIRLEIRAHMPENAHVPDLICDHGFSVSVGDSIKNLEFYRTSD